MLIGAVWIDAGIVFNRAFTTSITEVNFRVAVSVLSGFSIAVAILLTSIHTEILPKLSIRKKDIGFPEMFGIFSVFLMLMVFDVFGDDPKNPHKTNWYLLVIFLSIFRGLIDYLYAHLYVGKQKADNQEESAVAELKRKEDEFTEAQMRLTEYQESIIDATLKLKEAHKRLEEYQAAFTCPHCGKVSKTKTHSALKNHVNRCDKNPKNQ